MKKLTSQRAIYLFQNHKVTTQERFLKKSPEGTGKQAFHSEDVTDILASVVKSEPDWPALPEATPTKVRDLLRRCLQKDAARRSRDAAEIRFRIEEAETASAMTGSAVAPAVPPVESLRTTPLWLSSSTVPSVSRCSPRQSSQFPFLGWGQIRVPKGANSQYRNHEKTKSGILVQKSP